MSYEEQYRYWLEDDYFDDATKAELEKIKNNDDEIKDRFAVTLKFGTAGLRGTLGAGTNRMNIWVVRQATQGASKHRQVGCLSCPKEACFSLLL